MFMYNQIRLFRQRQQKNFHTFLAAYGSNSSSTFVYCYTSARRSLYVIQLFGAAKTAPDALYGKQKIRPGKTKKIVDVARLELATLLLHQAAEEAAAVCCFLQEIAGGGLM